jgi:hypothetical protein
VNTVEELKKTEGTRWSLLVEKVDRTKRLRRVILLIASFTRNLAYNRALDAVRSRIPNNSGRDFWLTIGGNTRHGRVGVVQALHGQTGQTSLVEDRQFLRRLYCPPST